MGWHRPAGPAFPTGPVVPCEGIPTIAMPCCCLMQWPCTDEMFLMNACGVRPERVALMNVPMPEPLRHVAWVAAFALLMLPAMALVASLALRVVLLLAGAAS